MERECETADGSARPATRSVPPGGGGGARAAGGGYISPSDDARVPGGRLSDGGEGAGGEVDREAAAERAALVADAPLRALPPSPWEVRAESLRASGVYPSGAGWGGELQCNSDGVPLKRVRNLVTILRNDARFRGLRFNAMTLFPEVDGRPLSDTDVTHMRALLERDWRVSAGKDLAQEAIRVAAELAPYDPRREYLGALAWDGVPRIERLAPELLGSTHRLYGAFLRCFLISAVARVYEPGCQVHTVLVLLGAQGAGKSTFFRTMFGEWFSDSSVEPGTREGMLSANSAWGLEIPEVEHLTLSREDSTLKRFITSATDNFRRPYAAALEKVPRSSIFGASTNERAFLRDRTGTGFRRWHVVEVFTRIDGAKLSAWRDQLWAEAMDLYRRGVPHWLTGEDEAEHAALTADYAEGEPWEAMVELFVASAANLRAVATETAGPRWAVSSHDLLTRGVLLETRELTSANQRRLAGIMAKLGATRSKVRVERGGRLGAPEAGYLLPAEWPAESVSVVGGRSTVSRATAAEALRRPDDTP